MFPILMLKERMAKVYRGPLWPATSSHPGRAALPGRPARRDRVDAAHLGAGEDGSRSEALHHSRRADSSGEDERLAGLLRRAAIA